MPDAAAKDAANDAAMARLARDLADALRAFARDRRPEQRTVVADLQTQLCATRRGELSENDGTDA